MGFLSSSELSALDLLLDLDFFFFFFLGLLLLLFSSGLPCLGGFASLLLLAIFFLVLAPLWFRGAEAAAGGLEGSAEEGEETRGLTLLLGFGVMRPRGMVGIRAATCPRHEVSFLLTVFDWDCCVFSCLVGMFGMSHVFDTSQRNNVRGFRSDGGASDLHDVAGLMILQMY